MSKNTDENNSNHLLDQLKELGLSQKEAQVYLALLPRHDTGTSKIIRATGLHGQFVYDALERLETLGLAKHVIQNGRKKFSANTPNRLVVLVDEKRLKAHAVARELQQRFQGSHEQDFEVYKGLDAFRTHEFELLERMPEGSTVDVIGGSKNQFIEIIGEEMEEYEKIRNRKNIHVRLLTTVDQAERFIAMANTRKNFSYRIIPFLESGITDADIWPNCLVLKFYGDPILAFALTSKEIAESYRQFFEALWKSARE